MITAAEQASATGRCEYWLNTLWGVSGGAEIPDEQVQRYRVQIEADFRTMCLCSMGALRVATREWFLGRRKALPKALGVLDLIEGVIENLARSATTEASGVQTSG